LQNINDIIYVLEYDSNNDQIIEIILNFYLNKITYILNIFILFIHVLYILQHFHIIFFLIFIFIFVIVFICHFVGLNVLQYV
jgi:hypothetical protein